MKAPKANDTKVMVITLPNRIVNAGEYLSAYGYGDTHEAVFHKYVKPRKTQQWDIEREIMNDNIVLTIRYSGKLGTMQLVDIELFCNKNFILNIWF